jgi:cytochrome c553
MPEHVQASYWRRNSPLVALIIGVVCVLSLAPSALGETSMRTTNDGVFTIEQADSARSLYAAQCAQCHGRDLGGGANQPGLRGFAFEYYWTDKSLAVLFGYMKATMPQGSPGSLTDSNYAALVALILAENGFEPGDEPLPADMAVLSTITLVAPERPDE